MSPRDEGGGMEERDGRGERRRKAEKVGEKIMKEEKEGRRKEDKGRRKT